MYFSTGSQLSTALASLSASKVGQFLAFDALYYSNTYMLNGNTSALTPIEHFVQYGAAAMAKPNATFDPVYYKQHYADLAGTNLNAADLLYHFMQFGLDEGRLPNATLAAAFNSTAYLAAYPDVAAYVNANLAAFGGSASNGALAHYVKFGAAQGFTLPVAAATGTTFNLTDSTATNPELLAVKTMHLMGDMDVRIDITDKANQITGLDLNGNGIIALDGKENALNVHPATGYAGGAANYVAVDAYPRLTAGVMDQTNLANVFLGDIAYDGTGYAGDGVKTNGNIVLGGLGADTILGGIGNDFLAGGGMAQSRSVAELTAWLAAGNTQSTFVPRAHDNLQGGRNADFMFVELSLLSATDGNQIIIDGGNTSDDTVAGANGPQDSDWVLLQASDDDETITVNLADDRLPVNGTNAVWAATSIVTRAGQVAHIANIENVDASGNLYGFLKGMNTTIGGAPSGTVNPNNDGIGSTGQLNINGSARDNKLIGGYDNDAIAGGDGNDLLMGGNLNKLINPNSVGITTDGKDTLLGGAGTDQIAFEADKGTIDGGDGTDTLWLTAKSLGTGTAATVLSADQRMRFDLAVNTSIASASGYGGADRSSQDQTKYATTTGIQTGAVTVSNMENVIATGLGAVDYAAAGTNTPELGFDNIQNFKGYVGDMDLRGTNGADQTTLITAANPGSITWTFTTTGGAATVPFTFADAATTAAQARAFVTTSYPAIAATLTAAAPASSAIVAATAAVNSIATYVGGENTLYANAGNDVLEGRGGNDKLSGGDGNDDFVFFLQNAAGDGVDVIHRQADTNGDNLWDGYNSITNSGGTFVQDFGQVSAAITANSKLTLTLTDTTNPADLTGFPVNGVAFKLDGVSYTVPLASGVQSTYAAFTAGLNTALDANPALAALNAVLNANNTITITDPAGKTFVSVGYTFVGNVVPPAGTLTWNQNVGGPDVSQTMDRLIYNSYADRNDNELVHDDAVIGTIISLGRDAYAQDLVVNFAADGTRISEDQAYVLKFTNLTTRDKVTVAVNGVTYQLQVGVNQDGIAIAAEDGTGGTAPVAIQSAFLVRLTAFINNFMDANTAAGRVGATLSSSSPTSGTDTIRLTQVAYNGEETVFMTTPVVTLQNLSNGEAPSVSVTNTSSHEVLLFNFDGRNNNLNTTDVLFLGDTGVNRSTFETAKTVGQVLAGKEAVLVDGGTDDLAGIAVNTANNSPLNVANLNYSVHGDDFLLGGDGNDTITGGTGDDRVQGSKGTDTLDGGKNYYAVKVLGEAEARVLVWNEWEAANPTSAQSRLADPTLAGTILSSVTLITQSESGTATSSSAATANATAPGLFDDTLIYAQADFNATTTKFTVTLNNYSYDTVTGVVSLNNGGAGDVYVDLTGNGVTADDSTSKFTNFENVRTVSGSGMAVANSGQGDDTLNVSALSTDTGGIAYNLGSATVASMQVGQVRYSADAHDNVLRPMTDGTAVTGEFELAVIKVDGVENVIAGNGDDLLVIDQNEAAKNNTFTGGLGDDRIEYNQVFAIESTQANAQPTVSIKVDATQAINTVVGGTDTVTQTGGRVGTTVAVDTLKDVEIISLLGNTAQGFKEADVLDVTTLVGGAIVNYNDALQNTALDAATYGTNVGTVRALDGTLHLSIENLYQVENVWADGNDIVIVADAAVMGLNATEDTSAAVTPAVVAKDITFATFMDYDTLKTDKTRLLFAGQSTAQIEDVINEGEFKFSLSKTGTGLDTDTVDYSATTDNIAVVVELDATKTTQYVLVDGQGATFTTTGDMATATDRVDYLVGVERIVAANNAANESILDLTSSTKGLEVRYTSPVAADRVASSAVTEINAYDATGIKISDLSSSTPISRTYMEYVDAADVVDVAGYTSKSATWNRIEGSDNAERVIVASSHSTSKDIYNLRGGANEVKYNELTKSITLTLSVVDYSAASALTTGIITGTVDFQDGTGAGVEKLPYINAAGQGDTITSYTANNGIASGSLRIAASQDAEDNLKFSGLTDKLFLLAETGTTDNQITVKVGSGTAANSIVLTGFELVSDAATNDVYDFGSIANVVAGLDFIDDAADHDTVKVDNGAANAAFGGNAFTITMTGINATATLAAAGFDFDVLDATKVTDAAVTTLVGVAAGEGTDEVVIGNFRGFTTVNSFESVVLTEAAIAQNGTTFVLDTTANKLVAGAKTLQFNQDMNVLSFGGLALEDTRGNNTTLNATSGVTVTLVGDDSVTLIGGDGNDSLTGKGGLDTFVGGLGNDTLDGSRVAAIGEIATLTLGGGAAVLADLDTLTLTGNAATLIITASGGGGEILTASATADADQIGALLMAQTNTYLETQLGYGAGEIASKAYDAASNVFTLTFTSVAGNVANLASAVVDVGANTAVDMTSVDGNTAGAGALESSDTYIFAATAALNGVDTINNFNASGIATDDVLDVSAFLAGAYDNNAAVNATAGIDLSGGTYATKDLAVVFNKAALAASDIVVNTSFAAGKIGLADNGKAVVLVTADTNGLLDVISQEAYDVYYVQDTDSTATQNFVVTKVATINSAAELNAAAFASMPTVVTGSGAADALLGSAGVDRIIGLAGADTITGGTGADVMTGGTGADTFVFAAGASGLPSATNFDTITDFASASDVIDYAAALTITAGVVGFAAGVASISAGGVAAFNAGDNTTALRLIAAEAGINSNGAATAGQAVVFQGAGADAANAYIFVSDGVDGIGANDVLIQLVGVNTALAAFDTLTIVAGNATLA
jgi:hypothetical protein